VSLPIGTTPEFDAHPAKKKNGTSNKALIATLCYSSSAPISRIQNAHPIAGTPIT
jgi:hypothetical protein